jgi:hypothetical protein
MKGDLENLDEGIEATGADYQSICYDSTNYPIAICDLFQFLGEKAFEDLFQHSCVSKENYRLITYRLERMGYLHSDNQPEISDQERRSALREPSLPTSIQDGIEALAYSTKVIERLRIIDTIHNVLSYSKWAKVLGYSDKGACHDFLKKMENNGLVNITKSPGGIGVGITLTQKGKRVIAASF